MHELPTALLHLDLPGPNRSLPVGPSRVQGWLVAKTGWHYTDVRIVLGQRIFPGIHGFPRRDVAEYLKSPRPALFAGFEIPVELPIGAHCLSLEACSITGTWEKLETLEVTATTPDGAEPPDHVVPVRPREFGEALRVLLRRMGTSGFALRAGASAVIAETPRPHYLRHPHLPFRGHLDEPQAWVRSVFGRIAVSGWLFHETLAIKRVFATADLQAVQDLEYGRETPFLGRLHPNFPRALHCGFDGYLDLPAQLPLPVTVRVYAELEDGRWHLGSAARMVATDHEFAKQRLVRFSPLSVWRAWRTLHREALARGVKVEPAHGYRKEILAVWGEYAAQAPRQRPHRVRMEKSPEPTPTGPEKIGHVHYCTHNLSHQGAPLFLLEHARHLQRATGARLSVTSGQDGPLRREFESLGATVQVIDDSAVLAVTTTRRRQDALADLAEQVDFSAANLVIANTISAYWGVHLARQALRPVLFYIHESTPPRSFFRGSLPAAALALVEDAFTLADRVSFLTGTSERYFTPFSDKSNYCLYPGWIELADIDRFRATHSRDAERRQLGLAPEKKLVINVGTVCDRKGQHLFARAVDLLWHHAPALAASAEFLMIGGGDTTYDHSLADFLGNLGRSNLRIVPGTGEVYPYYCAADLVVCSSYEESFPRVILEAMAFEVPIVSTRVHGIPEMARADLEAVLVPPGDSAALAAALQRLLEDPAAGQQLAQQARARVAAEFDRQIILPGHLALARSLAKFPL